MYKTLKMFIFRTTVISENKLNFPNVNVWTRLFGFVKRFVKSLVRKTKHYEIKFQHCSMFFLTDDNLSNSGDFMKTSQQVHIYQYIFNINFIITVWVYFLHQMDINFYGYPSSKLTV